MLKDQFNNSERLLEQNPFGGYKAYLADELSEERFNGLLCVNTGIGIRVLTDSPEIIEQLTQIQGNEVEIYATLIYLTDGDLGMIKEDGTSCKRLSKGNVADLAVSHDLKTFAIAGPAKIGTLLGIAYGVRAFYQIEQGILGVHGALILDRYTEQVILIAGKGTSGKSTYPFLLQELEPGRFKVLGDEWCEISLESLTAQQVSRVIGESKDPNVNTKVKAHPDLRFIYESFGKQWYIHTDNEDIYQPYPISRVIELDIHESVQDEVYILRKNNSHIPFINSLCMGLPQEITTRLLNILNGYILLSLSPIYTRVDARSLPPEQTAKKMLEEL